ncbi:TPA: hypothetical protein RFB65_001326 [Yersinia enterocolitica]|nr:hypothetical protein [Yersinia enterocolitica]ELW8192081.1 hypothetical protein [Yersinia enterocolitica]HDM9019927.1 hypothetical protein [Yersinia enterocolitica]HDU2642355.1 hypothetical protein [Yersinia enterocolitica]HDW8054192.1 hypothetical protein [Yersinia enterocolitica]
MVILSMVAILTSALVNSPATIVSKSLAEPILFTLIATLISILSASFAFFSAKEARKANKLSLHREKMEIYNAFFLLKMHMLMRRNTAEMEEVRKFFHYKTTAPIYLKRKLAEAIIEFYNLCFDVAESHKHGLRAKTKEERIAENEKFKKIYKMAEDIQNMLYKEMKV